MYPESQVLQHRRAGAPCRNPPRRWRIRLHLHQERRGCHRLNGHLVGGDTLVVAIGYQVQQTVIQSCITMTPVLSCGTWRVSLIL